MSQASLFTLSEWDPRPGCREIKVHGELDLAVAEQLQAALKRAAAECGEILVGLESCEFIDSTGIATIVHAHNQLAEQGGRVVVYGACDQVLRVLSVTGLTANGLVVGSVEEALGQITTSPP